MAMRVVAAAPTLRHRCCRFFSQLAGRLDSIPQCMAVNKVLPALLAAHEFSNAGSAVLAPLFKVLHGHGLLLLMFSPLLV